MVNHVNMLPAIMDEPYRLGVYHSAAYKVVPPQ